MLCDSATCDARIIVAEKLHFGKNEDFQTICILTEK